MICANTIMRQVRALEEEYIERHKASSTKDGIARMPPNNLLCPQKTLCTGPPARIDYLLLGGNGFKNCFFLLGMNPFRSSLFPRLFLLVRELQNALAYLPVHAHFSPYEGLE